ncbi:MAG: hypothetical protein JWM99_4019 [Verrucomicrobiales bacterium]|nr:hypothetical protein [Verrucomicrobiales bacterium]
MVFTNVTPNHATDVSIPILASDYSIFDTAPGISQNKNNVRKLILPLPQGLVSLVPGYAVNGGPYVVALGSYDPLALANFTQEFGVPNPFNVIVQKTCKGALETGSALPSVLVTGGLYIRRADSLQAEFGHQISFYNTNRDEQLQHTYSLSDATVFMTVKGGKFNGKKLKLKAFLAQGWAQNQTESNWKAEADIFVMIPWGIDPFQKEEYLLIHIAINVEAGTSDPNCISLEMAYQKLGQAPTAYVNALKDDILSKLESGVSHLEGAIPELIYLYDFSGVNTVAPTNTVPADALRSPLETHSITYTNFDRQVNQYDSGTAFGLPVTPRPPKIGSAGGSACGPTSLNMALNVIELHQDPLLLYRRTVGANGFSFQDALDFLKGIRAFRSGSLIGGILPAAMKVTTIDTGPGESLTPGWAAIDTIALKKQPMVFRCSLPGGGHMILLVGKGHSQNVADLYGNNHSGDYYIFADPAGHYYANPNNAYTTISNLRARGEGANYGGWFAIYPIEDIRANLLRKQEGTNNPSSYQTLCALTIGQPFPGVRAEARGSSSGPAPHRQERFLSTATDVNPVNNPVTILVTDPQGRKTGVKPDGTIVNEIPNSNYIPEFEEEDGEDGVATIIQNGAKTIDLFAVAPGVYQVELTATNTGTYAFEWSQAGEIGTLPGSDFDFQDVDLGAQITYSITIAPNGGPNLQVSRIAGAIQMSWPTSAEGYSLQAADSLISPATWSALSAAVTITNDSNIVRIPLSSKNQFFRLSK